MFAQATSILSYTAQVTHYVYSGSCDSNRVKIYSYKGGGFVQIDEISITRQSGLKETIYAVDRTPLQSEFILMTAEGERTLGQPQVLKGLRIVAPNTFAMLLNKMHEHDKMYAILPNDCTLTNADTKGEWIEIIK